MLLFYANILKRLKAAPLWSEFHPLAESELLEIESAIQCTLDASYREYLRHVGGVALYAGLIRMISQGPKSGPNGRETINHLYGAPCEQHLGLLSRIQVHTEDVAHGLLPIGSDLMGNITWLILNGKRKGRVYFWDHDENVHYLAGESFSDFLDRLENEPENA